MIIDPKKKLRDLYFYNNLLLIICIFCALCFITYFFLENAKAPKSYYTGTLVSGQIFGPIKVYKGHPKIIAIDSRYLGADNNYEYISGEVLDENENTLYEFGKELWRESGYDSDGYWAESDTNMSAKLVFSTPGTYFIRFNKEADEKLNKQNSSSQEELPLTAVSDTPQMTSPANALTTYKNKCNIRITSKNYSGIPHIIAGAYMLIFASIAFISLNRSWVGELLTKINESMGED